MLIDISKAYLFALVLDNNIYVDLPPEMAEPSVCGRLKKALYGTRDAAHAWEQEYTQTLNNMGFRTGESSTCIFYHDARQLELDMETISPSSASTRTCSGSPINSEVSI